MLNVTKRGLNFDLLLDNELHLADRPMLRLPPWERRPAMRQLEQQQQQTISSGTTVFIEPDYLDSAWLIPYALNSTGIAINIGDMCYDATGGIAYPAGSMTTTGTELDDQIKFKQSFIGCATDGCLASETNATRQLTMRNSGKASFACPSQVFKVGQLLGIYSNGTVLFPQQLDAALSADGAIAVVAPAPGNPTYYAAAVTTVYAYFVSGHSGPELALAIALATQQAETQMSNPRNLIDGGDATTNPWQRGTSFTAIANTLTYTADRFFVVGGASSSISVSQQAQTDVIGFGNSLRFGRGSTNTNTAVINLGQVLETLDCIKAQGQEVTLSFWAKAGATFLTSIPAGFKVAINHSTTAGNDTAAHLVAASTNWQATPTIVNTTQIPTAAAVRYSFTGVVPATATQLGLLISYTPVGTAGATEYVDFYGFQLEIGGVVTAFEHRDIEVELALCQRYFLQIAEPASGVIVGAGMIPTSATQVFVISLPTQMRAAPTVTVSVGTFKVNLAGTATTPTTFAAGSTHAVNTISVVSANTGQTAGQATLLQGGGGSGYIQASADL